MLVPYCSKELDKKNTQIGTVSHAAGRVLKLGLLHLIHTSLNTVITPIMLLSKQHRLFN